MKNTNLFAIVGCAAFLVFAAGCTPEARQDVGEAGSKVGDATQKSAEGTAEAASKAGDAVVTGTKEAGKAVADGTKEAAQSAEKAAAKTGAAVADGTKAAVQGTEKAVAKAGDAASSAGDTLMLTPAVKNAILRDDKVKILDLDIDTQASTKEVTVTGTADTAAEKSAALADAKKALADKKSDYKLVDKLTVKAGAK